MELWEEISAKIGNKTAKDEIGLVCYEALKRIKEILEDDELEDPQCFNKIEEIVRVFEIIGSGCGNRHDFG